MKQVLAPVEKEKWAQPSSFLSHFQKMIGPYGLYEHATEQVPLLREGYCTDDNTRAVQVLVYLAAHIPDENKPTLETIFSSVWRFVQEARREEGSFYNLRTAQGEWEPQDVSNDMYARLIRALTSVIRYDTNGSRQEEALEMLFSLRLKIQALTASRAWAEVNIALKQLPADQFSTIDAQSIIQKNTDRLLGLWESTADDKWAWFEDTMVYSNALLPHGLLAARECVDIAGIDAVIENSTAFLLATTVRDSIFVPVGSVGWYPRGGEPSTENQQPIEAGTMFDFLVEYENVFPGKIEADVLLAPYLWFFGANTGRVIMANQQIGASYDGLFARGPNINYGAESMLAYLWAELRMRDLPEDLQQRALERREELLSSAAG